MSGEPTFRTPEEREVGLSPVERRFVLTHFPSHATIVRSEYFDNYNLPCPIHVVVEVEGNARSVVLRKTRHGSVDLEVRVLQELFSVGANVPEVLVGPTSNERGEQMSLLSRLAGMNLQKLSMASSEGCETAKELLCQGIEQLASFGELLKQSDIGIPVRRLEDALQEAESSRSEWLSHPLCIAARQRLRASLREAALPPVFTNGDYQPGNFLALEGRLTGILDFEKASFQDPLLGLAKFPVDDLHPLNKAGFVRYFLERAGFDEEQLSHRVALVALTKLVALPVEVDGERQAYVNHLLAILRDYGCAGQT